MTTDKTIYSVRRDLLEVFASSGGKTLSQINGAIQELRAILEAPACKTCKGLGHVQDGEVTGSGGVEFENGPVECVKDCPACKQASQPYGEPIYQVMYRGDGGGGWSDVEKDSYDMKVPHPKHWRTRIVYADQPVPVANARPTGVFGETFEGPRDSTSYAVSINSAPVVMPDRDSLRDIIAQAIGGDTYDCVRVWSAWGVGTMSEDDFIPVVHQEDRLYEIADACFGELKRLNQQLVSQCPGDGVGPCKNCRCDQAGQSPQAEKYDDVLLPFLEMMRKELHANAGKGDRPGWLAMSRDQGMLEIHYHASKLQKAVRDGNGAGTQEYAADVANMCMMLLDICGGLVNEQ